MWAAGYFVISTDNSHSIGGYGLYCFNLAALWNPHTVGVRLFDALPNVTFEQWEGVAYMGAGMIALFLLSMLLVEQKKLFEMLRRHWALLIVLLFLFVLAASNQIHFGSRHLFTISLPSFIEEYASLVRSSGRLFWPVYYCLLLFPFWVISRYVRRRFTIPLLVVALALQIYDLSPTLGAYRIGIVEWKSELISPVWDQLLEGKKNIAFVPAKPNGDDYLSFAYLAASRDKTFNTGYFARYSIPLRESKSVFLRDSVARGQMDPETLYILRENLYLKPTGTVPFNSGILDGFPFVAPGSVLDDDEIVPFEWGVIVGGEDCDLIELIETLGDYEYLVLSVRDDASLALSDRWKAAISNIGGNLNQLAFRGSYALVYSNSGIVKEALSNDSRVELELELDEVTLRVSSAGKPHGNVSIIELGGLEYSLNLRGINVVKLNVRSREMRRYSFDTCTVREPKSRAR